MANKEYVHNHEMGHECGSLSVELVEHFPYAVFSVALSFVGAALLNYFSFGAQQSAIEHGSHVLFHAFHFLHIVFAATGATLTFFRFSKDIVKGIVISTISTVFFCLLSDVFFPYFSGWIVGADMTLHICFISEFYNVLPFLVIGLFNGWLLAQRQNLKSFFSVWSHFAHIFVSSFASLMYMISHGMHDWPHMMGSIFIILVFAVVIPCTMSDVVIPIFFAKGKSN